MNLLLIILLALMIGCMAEGYKKGMVHQIISFVSMIVLCVTAALLANGAKNYVDGKLLNVVIVVVLLVLLGVARHFLGVFFFSAKMLSKLPIISWLNKLAGIVFGALEIVLVLWTVYTFVIMMDLGAIETWIMQYTAESRILTWLYENNFIAQLIDKIAEDFTFYKSFTISELGVQFFSGKN
ncbi:MAG: CvpA family protein [Bacteroidales bacterium]|nr:CvpA family protein [Lachnoclostridium sp.]MCM1384610.1 CvpA family protein [Lachnoclostridium sp.]MCM1465108.1 CvpA family protein [Bacteroidales bacterium]